MKAMTEAGSPNQIALVALTRGGLALACRLRRSLGIHATVYANRRALQADGQSQPNSAADGEGGALPSGEADIRLFEKAGPLLAALWEECDQLVLFFALGAAIRLAAPLLQHKRADPGVVVVDDAGQFAISMLAGHSGGANALCQRVAGALGALPVITTASDTLGLPSVDLLGSAWGWQIEQLSDVTAASAALVNGERVAVFQEAGEHDWWPPEHPWPANICRVKSLKAIDVGSYAALLAITDRLIDAWPPDVPRVIYRPSSLVLGVGCRRGTSCEQLEAFIRATLVAHRLAWQSVAVLATADIKSDEEGLLLLAERCRWAVETYPAEALAAVPVPTGAERVRQLVGTPSVSEAAALLSSRGGTLLVPKQKGNGMTVAVARRSYTRDTQPAPDAGARTADAIVRDSLEMEPRL